MSQPSALSAKPSEGTYSGSCSVGHNKPPQSIITHSPFHLSFTHELVQHNQQYKKFGPFQFSNRQIIISKYMSDTLLFPWAPAGIVQGEARTTKGGLAREVAAWGVLGAEPAGRRRSFQKFWKKSMKNLQ